jgi:nucleotide-binding universal stress UspA family protein
MSVQRPGPVVVGVDGSGPARAAVARAAWEARRRGADLLLVRGCQGPVPTLTPMPTYYDENEQVLLAGQVFGEAVARVRREYPDLQVGTKVVAASGGQALVEESRRASLVVVGARGRGGFAGVTLGSVADQVATHARCPVIVVRAGADAGAGDGPADGSGAGDGAPAAGSRCVVVGVDGSARSQAALAFAFDEAEARGLPLTVVHVWSIPEIADASVGKVWSPSLTRAGAQLRETAEDVLSQALAPWAERYPEVTVQRWSVHGDAPARILLEVATDTGAELVVVAARGRRGLAGMLLGSVSRTLVAHAHVSVAVVHAETDAARPLLIG